MNTNATRPKLNVERILPHLGRHQQPDAGVHQAILNIAYDRWQKTPGWDYSDMVNWMADEFGGIAKFAVLIGKFNQQVLNGGHSQYFGNGYCGQIVDEHNRRNASNDPSCPLHHEMAELMRLSCFSQTPIGSKAYEIIRRFRVEENPTEDCSDCGGSGECDYDCEECHGTGDIDDERCSECDGHGRKEHRCETCGGDGQVESNHPGVDEEIMEESDDAYGAINEPFMAELEQYFEQWVEMGRDPLGDLQPIEDQKPVPDPCQKPKLKLVGTDGNAFSVMGRACHAMKQAGCDPEHIEAYRRKAQSGDYDNVLATTMEFCDVC